MLKVPGIVLLFGPWCSIIACLGMAGVGIGNVTGIIAMGLELGDIVFPARFHLQVQSTGKLICASRVEMHFVVDEVSIVLRTIPEFEVVIVVHESHIQVRAERDKVGIEGINAL